MFQYENKEKRTVDLQKLVLPDKIVLPKEAIVASKQRKEYKIFACIFKSKC